MKYKDYMVHSRDNYLIVESLETGTFYRIKVLENNEYVYKINKKSISAKNGIVGLTNFIKKCIDEDFSLTWVKNIILGVLEKGEII